MECCQQFAITAVESNIAVAQKPKLYKLVHDTTLDAIAFNEQDYRPRKEHGN